MSCFLLPEDSDLVQKINIDELYERKHRRDQKQISVFNKILNRIHKRINTTAKMKTEDKFIWYQIPSFIFGEPLYDQTDCIAFVVTKLAENGFFVKFVHPGTLLVSWDNWVPSYMRQEIRKKTGYVLDEKGNVIDKIEKKERGDDLVDSLHRGGEIKSISAMEIAGATKEPAKKYTPINQYKPTGNLIYGDAFDKLEKRVSFK